MHNPKIKFFCKAIMSIVILLGITQQSSIFAKTKTHENTVFFTRQQFKISKKNRITLDAIGAALISSGLLGGALGATEIAVTERVGIKYINDR